MTDCVWQNISIEIPDKLENTFRFGSRPHDLSTGGEYFQNSLSHVFPQRRALLKVTSIAVPNKFFTTNGTALKSYTESILFHCFKFFTLFIE